MARIFVSSTFKDLKEYREKVSIALRQMGHEDVAMEYFVAVDERPLNMCEKAVASSDLYIGIFALRYGYKPPRYKKSITEIEYRKAVECGIECLIFLLHEEASWQIKYIDKGEDSAKLESLKNELLKNSSVRHFKSPDELAKEVIAAVHNWEKKTKKSVLKNRKIAELDLNKYREAISIRYCNIDLDALSPSKKEDFLKIQLSSVFVEQNVRENPPPVELPKEIWNKMHEEWDPESECLPASLSSDDIRHAKESYYSKDPKPVLDVVCDEINKYIVILGDPGSGKSTLTKYIILSVLQINNDKKLSTGFSSYLPLRIELREFAWLCGEKKCKTFLNYLNYLAENEGFSLSGKEIENYLKSSGEAIVVFDGLDEIFDPKEWERINKMIVGFALDYPKVRIIVTSRIVGYKRKILDDAGFVHFTLQDFEKEQIEAFLDNWYPLVVDQKEVESRKSRIIRALKDSPSIRQLAGNPLLLTIMVIIGKHQELPRERWKLYDHVASVLVENWEVNKHLKRSSVDMDFIGEDDKKELLMKIAFKMQSSPKGLAGNFIHRKTLQQEIEVYLQNRYQKNHSEAKTIAESIIDQLRRVNFILCLYGADFYGFVHRTFLEYFCALDIVKRFDNRELDPETLNSDYYKNYWEEPSWHEVLSLICGMKEKFAGEIIESLMQVYNPKYFGNRPPLNISLAIKCLSELRNPYAIGGTAKRLLERILKLFEMVRWTQDINQFLVDEVVPASKLIGDRWPHHDIVIDKFSHSQVYKKYYFGRSIPDINLNISWAEFIAGVNPKPEILHKEALKKISNIEYSSLLGVLILGKCEMKDTYIFSLLSDLSTNSRYYFVRQAVIQELARNWRENPKTFNILKQKAMNDEDNDARCTAIEELARGWRDDPETLRIIKQRATQDEYHDVRCTAVEELARGWHDDPETLEILKQRITQDEYHDVRRNGVKELARGWRNNPETLKIIKQRATQDEDNYVRSTAILELAHGWPDDPETFNFLKQRATKDKDDYVRSAAVQELSRGWHGDIEILDLLKQMSMNYENKYVRCMAVKELTRGWHDDPEIFKIIKQRASEDDIPAVRCTAIQELARNWHDDPEILKIIKRRATEDNDPAVRSTAVQELARNWYDDQETLKIIKQRASEDDNPAVRSTAVQELTRGWHDDPEILKIIKQRATEDNDPVVRSTAVQELAKGWHDDQETLKIIKQLAMKDVYYSVRCSAVQELLRGWHNDLEILKIIKQLAMRDKDTYVRWRALDELAHSWPDDPETYNIIKQQATTDTDTDLRVNAVLELARGWSNNPETLIFIKQLAIEDEDNYVRSTAIQELVRGWPDVQETRNFIELHVMEDENYSVRMRAVEEYARGFHDDPDSLKFIKHMATNDKNYLVRITAVKELARSFYDDPETLKFIKQKAIKDVDKDVRSTAILELAHGWPDDPKTLKFIKHKAVTDEDKDNYDCRNSGTCTG